METGLIMITSLQVDDNRFPPIKAQFKRGAFLWLDNPRPWRHYYVIMQIYFLPQTQCQNIPLNRTISKIFLDACAVTRNLAQKIFLPTHRYDRQGYWVCSESTHSRDIYVSRSRTTYKFWRVVARTGTQHRAFYDWRDNDDIVFFRWDKRIV